MPRSGEFANRAGISRNRLNPRHAREEEIEACGAREYWTVVAQFERRNP
jgi:hypothetical protein